MAEYKAIHGTTVSNRTSDPLVSGTAAGSWSSGGDVNTARYELGAGQAATTHATAIIFAGYNGTAFVANAETYNGSAWSETGDLNTARGAAVGGSGNSSTALAVGAYVTANSGLTEEWDGSSWSESGDLNTARRSARGFGLTQNDQIYCGGYSTTLTKLTESYNGSSWSEVGDQNANNSQRAGCGSPTAGLLIAGGPGTLANVESWDGSSWTEIANVNTARLDGGCSGTQAEALFHGGTNATPALDTSTEYWNGTSWTEVNNLSVARAVGGGLGSAANGLQCAGYTGTAVATTEEWTAGVVGVAILNDGQTFYRSDTGDMKVSLTQYGTGAWASGGSMPSGRSARPTGAGTQTASVVFGGNPAGNVTLTYNGTAFATPGNNLNDGRYNSAGLGTSTAAFNVSGVPTSLPDLSVAVESWNGTSWTEIAEVNTGRDSLSAAANSTTSAALVFGGNNPSVTGITELWDGSSWTEVADMNTARKKSGGFGTSTSAIAAGGYISTNSNAVESWDGTSWTEVAECTAKDNCGASGVSGVLGQIFGGSPFVAVTQQWDGSSWTEVADLATARDQLGGTGNSTVTALAFGGRTPGGAVANTEEWTVPESISNLTITD